MSVVLKISKPGYNVLTTGNENLTFNAELATHAIYNVIESTEASTGAGVTITHNLGYIPKTWVFMEKSDGDGDYLARIPIDDIDDGTIDFYINTTQIVIQTSFTTGAKTFKVVIFTRTPTP